MVLSQGILQKNSTALRLLDLRSNGITETGAMSLQGLIVSSYYLTSLNLSNNELGSTGATALARGLQQKHCILQKLDVSANGIDRQGAIAVATMLRANMVLVSLNLSFNSIGDEGATAIAVALQRNHTLKMLSLRRNNITNAGAKTIADKLPSMPALKELLLSKNNIGQAGASALLDGLRSNVELEYLHVDDEETTRNGERTTIAREIVHWVRLNKAGRRIFRHTNTVPDPLWSRVYGRISHDSNVLFHFLTEKPDVVFPVNNNNGIDTELTMPPPSRSTESSSSPLSSVSSPKRKKKRCGDYGF